MTAAATQAVLTLKAGDPVIFERLLRQGDGERAESFNAIVLGTITEEGHLGSKGEPALSLAFLNPDKVNLLGGSDWRDAFERVTPVKHISHDDLAAGKETQRYQESAASQPTTEEIRQQAFRDGYEASVADGKLEASQATAAAPEATQDASAVSDPTEPSPSTSEAASEPTGEPV